MKIFTALNLIAFAVLISYSSAFSFTTIQQRQMAMDKTTTALQDRQRLSDIDLMAIENVAELCVNVESMVEECDLEEHEALVNQLSEQRDIIEEERSKLDEHVQYLNEILSKLRGHEVNGHTLDENEIVYDQ